MTAGKERGLRPLTAFALTVALASALACGSGNGDDPEAELVGMWQRQTDDGLWVVREFVGPDQGAFTNRNWAYAEGEEPVLLSEGRYFVTEETEVPGGGDRKHVLTVNPVPPAPMVTIASPLIDEIVSVSGDKLVLSALYDDTTLEYEKTNRMP